jgi:hypothetical protein
MMERQPVMKMKKEMKRDQCDAKMLYRKRKKSSHAI